MYKMESQRIRTALLCLLLFAALPMPVSCQHSQDDSGLPVPIYDDGCRALMKAVHQEWSRSDGELSIVLCKKLIWVVLLNPNAFYREFSVDSVQYDRFLECVEYNLFRNYSDTATSHLERLRLVALDRLQEQTYSIDSNYLQLHEELIDKIKQVEPTFVD